MGYTINAGDFNAKNWGKISPISGDSGTSHKAFRRYFINSKAVIT